MSEEEKQQLAVLNKRILSLNVAERYNGMARIIKTAISALSKEKQAEWSLSSAKVTDKYEVLSIINENFDFPVKEQRTPIIPLPIIYYLHEQGEGVRTLLRLTGVTYSFELKAENAEKEWRYYQGTQVLDNNEEDEKFLPYLDSVSFSTSSDW